MSGEGVRGAWCVACGVRRAVCGCGGRAARGVWVGGCAGWRGHHHLVDGGGERAPLVAAHLDLLELLELHDRLAEVEQVVAALEERVEPREERRVLHDTTTRGVGGHTTQRKAGEGWWWRWVRGTPPRRAPGFGSGWVRLRVGFRVGDPRSRVWVGGGRRITWMRHGLAGTSVVARDL